MCFGRVAGPWPLLQGGRAGSRHFIWYISWTSWLKCNRKNPSTKWLRNISPSLTWEKSRFGSPRLVWQYHIIRGVGSRHLATPSLRPSASRSRWLLKFVQLRLYYRQLEKEMATHSSFFAWEIPWTEECGGRQSMGSQKSQSWLSDRTATATTGNCHTWKLFSSLRSWKRHAWHLWVSPSSDVSFLKSFLVYSGSATWSLIFQEPKMW